MKQTSDGVCVCVGGWGGVEGRGYYVNFNEFVASV